MLRGDAGPNLLQGGAGTDIVVGLEGDDELYGATGHDVVYGGPGNDELAGDWAIDEGAPEVSEPNRTGDWLDCGDGTDLVSEQAGDALHDCERLELPLGFLAVRVPARGRPDAVP